MKQISIVCLVKDEIDEHNFVKSIRTFINQTFGYGLLKDIDYYVKNIPKKIERGR